MRAYLTLSLTLTALPPTAVPVSSCVADHVLLSRRLWISPGFEERLWLMGTGCDMLRSWAVATQIDADWRGLGQGRREYGIGQKHALLAVPG